MVTMHSKAQYNWETYVQVFLVHRSTSSILCFWVDCNFVKAHNRKASWHEKEESPRGSTLVTEILPPTPTLAQLNPTPTPTHLNPHPTQPIPIPINPSQSQLTQPKGQSRLNPLPPGKPLPPTSALHLPIFPRVLVLYTYDEHTNNANGNGSDTLLSNFDTL